MAPPKSDWEQHMLHLEGEIRRLEAEFNMFFAGRLPRPPWETKTRVAALVKKHDTSYIRNTADRFRFESLQSRYQKFIELCDRQLTNRELGRPMLGARRTEPPPAPPKVERATPADPHVIRVTRDQATGQESETVKQLFERLSEARKQVGEAPVSIERLAALVTAQVGKFAAEGKDVSFKIATKDGKVQLSVIAEERK
jgi:hypothetical protein